MCGIAGIVNFRNEGLQLSQLKLMTDSIIHRGPDGEGHWINESENVGFGHRRLSIIDLSNGGHQPMHYLDRFTITFNGEIYNYIELRKELKNKGYVFKSESDTEVLLALFAEKGHEMLNLLDGMFAFAIWDKEKRELFCARDRFGEKPFFYSKKKERFIFGSEMKALWAGGVKKEIKEDRLNDYVFGNRILASTDGGTTFFKEIEQLDASHYAIVKENGEFKIEKYWSLDNIKINYSISFEDAKKEYYRLFEESIKRRMRSDVAVGSSLSGGIDSSSIVCVMNQLKVTGQTQKTFSARFKDFDRDEGRFIEEVIQKCDSIEGVNTWPSESDIINIMEKAAFHQEEPFGSSSILAQWKVMELAKKNNVTVLLDGQGADEYLAGYLSEYKIYLYQLYLNNRNLYKQEYKAYMAKFEKTIPITDFGETETLRMKLGRVKKKLLNQPFDNVNLKQSLNTLLTKSRLKELLRYSDRNAMAHSREVRLPFLSHKLVEFTYSLPDDFLLRSGWTKYIHRKALEPLLPENICWRVDKVGYEAPQKSWMNNSKVAERVKHQQNRFTITDERVDNNTNYGSMEWRLFMSSFIEEV